MECQYVHLTDWELKEKNRVKQLDQCHTGSLDRAKNSGLLSHFTALTTRTSFLLPSGKTMHQDKSHDQKHNKLQQMLSEKLEWPPIKQTGKAIIEIISIVACAPREHKTSQWTFKLYRLALWNFSLVGELLVNYTFYFTR